MKFVLLLAACPAILAQPKKVTYDDDVRPIVTRRCMPCHNASEARASLSLDTYAGVMKGGGSGDIVKPGRPAASVLYLAVAHEGTGVPRMPLNGAKLPEGDIAIIREFIQQGILENVSSQPKGSVMPSLDFRPVPKPTTVAAAPTSLPPFTLPEPPRPHPVTALAASPWAPIVALAGHGRIHLYDTNTRASIGVLPFPEGTPFVLRFSRDGVKLIAAGGKGVQSGSVVVFDIATGKRITAVGAERDIVAAADISPDGKLIALGGPSKVVKVFSTEDGKLIYEIKKHTDWITALEFSPDGTRLATGDRAGGIYLWESGNGGILLALAEHKDAVQSLSWRPDSRLLASGGEDGELVVWDPLDGFPVTTDTKGHVPAAKGTVYGNASSGVLSVHYLNDGRLVSIGRDRVIHLWNSQGKSASASAPAAIMLTKVTSSFDSKFVIAGDYEGNLLYWDGKKLVP
ncbi:MAG: hypothetical protein HYZ37_02630 [Candidatus Solibacter usitatus]|nr:hypothetical protein [Candidatus Solibacter usitatus]